VAGGVSQPSLRGGASDYVIFFPQDGLGGNNYAQGGRKKVEQAGEKQVTKKLVECVLVAQRQTFDQ